MKGFVQDLRQSWRKWRREPRTSLLVVTALALGIGANTAVFSLVQTVLFRSLPVERPEQLVRVFNTEKRGGQDAWSTSLPIYQDYRDQSTAFSGLAAYRGRVPVHLSVDGAPPERIRAGMVSGNYFQMLGVRSLRGRLLSPEDDAGSAPPRVALSHGLWQRRFAGDPAILGRTVLLNGSGFTIVGVTPPGFTGIDPGRGEEIWLPLAWAATADPTMRTQLSYRSSAFFHLVGRLRPGASPASALTQLETVASRQRAAGPANPEEEGFEEPWPRVVPLAATIHPEGIRLSWLLLGTVLLVLLAACADVAGYLLARSERDQRQVAVRLALGATRVRIVRQLLAEGLLFAGAGALGGLLLGGWVARVLVRMAPPRLPIPLNPDLDILDPGSWPSPPGCRWSPACSSPWHRPGAR